MLNRILAYLLAAFFLFGAWSNANASEAILQNYGRWGYPAWFHYMTAVLELATAGLLVFQRTRFFGAALGALVMLAAGGTVSLNDGIDHAIPAFVVLVVSLFIFFSLGVAHMRPKKQSRQQAY